MAVVLGEGEMDLAIGEKLASAKLENAVKTIQFAFNRPGHVVEA